MFSPPSHCCPRILTTNFHTYKALVSTVILVNNFKKPLHFFKINPQSSLFKKIKNFPHRRVSHTKRLDLFFPHVISYLLHTQPTIQPPQMFSPPHCCCCILTLNFTSPYPSPLTSPRLFRTTIKKHRANHPAGLRLTSRRYDAPPVTLSLPFPRWQAP